MTLPALQMAREEKHAESRIGVMSETAPIATATPGRDIAEISIASVTGLAIALIVLFLCMVQLAPKGRTVRDFVIYWATGQQLIHHQNPYDQAALEQIEHAAGFPANFDAFYMRNPPWTLPLVFPLGLVQMQFGNLLWSLVLLGCQIGSGWLVWQMFGRPPNHIHWLAVCFAPALICTFMGQTALFALLGVALFLRFNRTHPFSAGLALWLCALKPHLFLPIGIVLLAWIIVARQYRVLAGLAVALAASCALTSLIYPPAWSAYIQMMHSPAIAQEPIPCLSAAMRLHISPQTVWLQFLPAALACVWGLGYYWRRRTTWDWMRDGSQLMLVSLIAAPYCWIYDHGIAIPALLHGAYTTRSRLLIAFLALVNIPIFGGLVWGLSLTSELYLWIAPLWLAWYLLARAFDIQESAAPARAIPIGHTAASMAIAQNDSTVQGTR